MHDVGQSVGFTPLVTIAWEALHQTLVLRCGFIQLCCSADELDASRKEIMQACSVMEQENTQTEHQVHTTETSTKGMKAKVGRPAPPGRKMAAVELHLS